MFPLMPSFTANAAITLKPISLLPAVYAQTKLAGEFAVAEANPMQSLRGQFVRLEHQRKTQPGGILQQSARK